MTITLELPEELAVALRAEAERLHLSLAEYIVQLLWEHVRMLKSARAADVPDEGDDPEAGTAPPSEVPSS